MTEHAQTKALRAWVRLDNATIWPHPADPMEVEWRLRYGSPSRRDLLLAASYIHAYGRLVGLSARDRNRVATALRNAASAATPEEGTTNG